MVIAKFEDVSSVRVSGLWQWDYGQVLRIQGLNLPMAAEIHFSLRETGGEAVTRIGVTKDGVTDVVIPDSMLENAGTVPAYNIYAFVYLTDETSGQTEYKITLSVKARPKPEAFDTPEEAELFRKVIVAVNESAGRAEDAEESAEAWAHGHEDYPERAQDNAMYYAGVAQEGASQTAEDKAEVRRLAGQVFQAEGTVAADKEEVKELKSQAQAAAANALQSEQNAKASEESSQAAEAGAEAAEDQAALYARQTEADMNTVEQAKAVIMQAGEEVTANKEAVEQTVSSFALTAQKAVDDVNAAGQAQIENIQTAGAGAVAGVNAAKMEAVQSVQNEGAVQVANVQAAAAEIEADREQIQQSADDITALESEIRLDAPGIIESATGETILVTDSSNKPFAGMRQYGRTTQETTTGQQLYDKEKDAWINPGSVSADDEGWVTIVNDNTDGTSVRYVSNNIKHSMDLKPDTDYLVVVEIKEISGVSTDTLQFISNYKPEGAVSWSQFETSFEKNFRALESGKTYTRIVKTRSGEDFENAALFTRTVMGARPGNSYSITYRMSIYKDTTITTDDFVYEPYTGGVPSPNPEYPQELESAGNDGEIVTEVIGANLIDTSTIKTNGIGTTIQVAENGRAITVTGGRAYASGDIVLTGGANLKGKRIFLAGEKDEPDSSGVVIQLRCYTNSGAMKYFNFSQTPVTIPDNVVAVQVRLIVNNTGVALDEPKTVIFRNVSASLSPITTWEPYKPKQTLIHTTPNGLPGIPVTSGGNYTDESGQQWIADYRDWGRGVDVQMVRKIDCANAEWMKSNNYGNSIRFNLNNVGVKPSSYLMCNIMQMGIITTADLECVNVHSSSDQIQLQILESRLSEATTDGLKEYFAVNSCYICYILAVPIETPIPADELAAYRAAHTNKTTTTIINDDGVYTEVEYVADTEAYISQNYVPKETYTALEQRVAALEANAIS